jgi:hypothetical protein
MFIMLLNGCCQLNQSDLTVYLVLLERAALKILCLFSSLFLILAYFRILLPAFGSKQLLSLFSKKKGEISCVGNYRLEAIFSSFPKVFEFIIYYHVSRLLKSESNPSQHCSIKSKPAVINVVTFVDFVTPLVCSQGQTDILPHKLRNYGLPSGYLNWFLSY